MPPKSDPASLLPLDAVDFLASKSTSVDFSVPGSELLIRVEAHAPGVFRLRAGVPSVVAPEKQTLRAQAHADMLLARHEPVGELVVTSNVAPPAQGWRLEQGDVALELVRECLGFALFKGHDCVLGAEHCSLLHCNDPASPDIWQWQWRLHVDDCLHGGALSSDDLDRRGQCHVSDRATDQALSLIWSTRGWGVYFNTFNRIEYDLGAQDPDIFKVRVHDRLLDVFVFVGEPAEIINQFTALTGRAGQPGLWPMGVWLNQVPGQSIDETLAVAQQFRDQHFGLDVVRLADPAPFAFQADKAALEWDTERTGSVRDLAARFSALNLQLAAPTFPGVLHGTGLFEEWEDRGWLLINDDDGAACVFPGTPATGGKPFGLLDLTHKDVYKFWSERLRQVYDDGLGAVTCDARFDIPDTVTARGGETGALLRTQYPLLVRKALFDAFAGHKTPQEGVILSTDLFPAVQRFAWQSGAAPENTWEGMVRSLRQALSLGDAGVPLHMYPLGSTQHPVDSMTPELYLRWLALCTFSGNFSFQSHAALLPSAFDEQTQAMVQHWLQWRYRLVPYVLGIIEDAVRTGLPVQRSMALAFPNDPMAQAWDTQYMFGPALLVAPVTQSGTQTRVYLPEGSAWWDLNTGWRYEGGTTWTLDVGLDTLPVFGREGHMLCLGPVAESTADFNSARLLEEVWMFGMPEHSPVVMRNKIRVMQMQGSSYIKGLEGLKILPSEGLEVKRRGAEVRISRAR